MKANSFPRCYHPFCFAVFPPLCFYVSMGITQNRVDVVFLPVVFSLIVTSIILLVAQLVMRDKDKAAILVTSLWAVFYSLTIWVIVKCGFQIFGLGRLVNGLDSAFMLTWWTIVLVVLLSLVFISRSLSGVSATLNKIGLSLVLIEVLIIGLHEAQYRLIWEPQAQAMISESKISISDQIGMKPDIYYIVLDEAASARVFKHFFGHDSSPFLAGLQNRGFKVALNSHSNYPKTLLSVSSALNFTYENQLASICGTDCTDFAILYNLLLDNRVSRLLKQAGYRYIQFGSQNSPTDWNPYADVNYPCSYFNHYQLVFFKSTILGISESFRSLVNRDWRRQKLCAFSGLAEVARQPGPKFVFAHILLPHDPFLFGPNGEAVDVPQHTEFGSWSEATKIGYRDQSIFTEKITLQAIDEILKNSKRQPIIILQGDHGAGSAGLLDNPHPSDDALVARFGILNAYLLPDDWKDRIYDGITPVNSFRIILNSLLGTKLGKLEDRCYYQPKPYLFRLTDVTERIAKREAALFSK